MAGATEENRAFDALLAARSPEALDYLYQFAPRLERVLSQKFGAGIPEEDIKDIVCDTLIRAVETGDRFDRRRARLLTWLNTLAHYEALDFLRRHPRTISLDQLVSDIPVVAPEQTEGDHEPGPQLMRALRRLPQRRSRVLLMYYFERYSTAEIAGQLHISTAAVKSHLSHARSDLRLALAGERRR